ncbi:MAG: enhanced serine sensitivity protein SseB C-terminal domain-containing protein [Anaerolineae bacterium]|nr:enhanced serine sensitivity protein SseB C-terminal domain-containing protein [Anaerolineae bacterium]
MIQQHEEELGITNPAVSAALQAIAQDDTPENRLALYQALKKSTLILPTPESEDLDAVAEPDFLGEDEALTFMTYENDAGGIVMIAFTDEEAALTWEPEGLPYLGLHGRDLLLIAAENEVAEIALNPASASSYRLGREEIAALTQGESPEQRASATPALPQGMTVLVGPPEETPPRTWREGLASILKHYPSIETAYFFQLHIPPEGGRHVIGLVLYEGMSVEAQNRMMDTLVSELEAELPQDQALDFVVLDDPDFRQTVRDTVSPIYRA